MWGVGRGRVWAGGRERGRVAGGRWKGRPLRAEVMIPQCVYGCTNRAHLKAVGVRGENIKTKNLKFGILLYFCRDKLIL